MKTRDMAYISISAALIALCAWLSVPAAIPFTMQTFAVFAAAGTLGARRGAAALGLYILLGALGLPVFSGFQGGVGALLGATGGYIVGFLPPRPSRGWGPSASGAACRAHPLHVRRAPGLLRPGHGLVRRRIRPRGPR